LPGHATPNPAPPVIKPPEPPTPPVDCILCALLGLPPSVQPVKAPSGGTGPLAPKGGR
jgi:hypothetical protein